MSSHSRSCSTTTHRRLEEYIAAVAPSDIKGSRSTSEGDGRIEIDNNTVERTIRPIAFNRKNALFAGHDAGAENRATIASLIETCKRNAIDPFAYLSATLTAIGKGHRQRQIDVLMPWNYSRLTNG